MMINIRSYKDSDWTAVWHIVRPVFRAGETYAFSPDISEAEARRVWVHTPSATFVAENEDQTIIGTYYIKANQPALGAHVCNCGYIVAEAFRGKGIASEMCRHSQQEAVSRGFGAMQYNLVVATNADAVHLWQKHGFEVVGTLPKAFRHSKMGLVDALIMYKLLID